MMVFGCLLCFLAGAGTVLGTLYMREKLRRPMEGAERDREQEKLREQWENFLSYNGTEQGGGF